MYQASAASPVYGSPVSDYRSPPMAPAAVPYTFSPPPVPPSGFSPMPTSTRYPAGPQYAAPYARPPPHGMAGMPPQPPYPLPAGGFVPAGYGGQMPAPPPMPAGPKHKGTLAPGQLIRVGEQTVRVERYLSEGGYAHVYLTSSEKPIYPPKRPEAADKKGRWGEKGYTEHCLKRIAFEDESVWADVRKEIEVMKALPPSPHLVQYLGSTHTKAPNGKHEVFILMEFCAGGGIIDFLNKRLRDRLSEIEILNIFTDVCEAVAAMHALARPLLHRDLKIENVLSHPLPAGPSSKRPTPLIFKLCDFGSTTFPASRPPQNKNEAEALALDLNKHTTLQYRSPEMVEPMLGWAVGLPSDVWALGVLLYKLCYYTTPFEEHGTLAIVNAKYSFPQYPVYSPKLQHLIASMLVEQPPRRPSVFEVLKVAHDMSGTRPGVDYGELPSRSLPRPPTSPGKPRPSGNLLDFTDSPGQNKTPVMQPMLATTVQPGRRGRPGRDAGKQQIPTLPSMPQQPTSNAVPATAPQPGLPSPAITSGPKTQSSGAMPQPSIQVTGHQPPVPAKDDKPRMQVTGDRPAARPLPSPSTSFDAFGLPTNKPSATSPTNGFGDSFAAPRNPASGFGDSFAKPAAKYGSSLQRPHAGSAGSNGNRPRTLSMLSAASQTSPKRSVSSASKPSSPSLGRKRTPDPSSSIPDGELTFEQRFPSIETMSSDDAFSPSADIVDRPPLSRQVSASMPRKTSESARSPELRPTADTRPSFSMANRTGGDFAGKLSSLGASSAPQPRSTQVTGTAFRREPSQLASSPSSSGPSPAPARQESVDYFASTEAEAANLVPAMSAGRTAPPAAQDLMAGEDAAQMSMPLLQPTLSRSPSSTLQVKTSRAPPATAPKPAAIKTNLPVPPSVLTVPASADSSGDEGPESASGTGRRPPSPVRRDSRQTSPRIAQRMSMFEQPASAPAISPPRALSKSATIPYPSPGIARRTSADRRPMSMYNPPASNGGIAALLSPPAATKDVAPAAEETQRERPTHERRSSINDMVSRYESMATPSAASSGSIHRKPSIASKPAALRKPTVSDMAPPAEAKRVAPKPVDKPASLSTRAKAHGEAPAPIGYSRSSAGRSFPIYKAAEAGGDTAHGNGGDIAARRSGSGSSSPEKQQPVNALIAKWNKGEVKGSASAPARRGGYI